MNSFDPSELVSEQDYLSGSQGIKKPEQAAKKGLGFNPSELVVDKEANQGFIGTLADGTKSAARSIGATVDTYAGDAQGVIDKSKDQSEQRSDIDLEKFNADVAKNTGMGGDEEAGLWDSVKGVGRAIASNPRGAGLAVVEQLPNSVPALAGGYAGMKAGAAVGAAAGAPFAGVGAGPGAFIGGIVGGLSGMFLGNTLIETGGKALEYAQDGEFTPEEMSKTKKEGAVKAGVITGIDALTLGVGGKISGAMRRTTESAVESATQKVLLDAGVDISDTAAVTAAKNNPALKEAVTSAQQNAAKITDTLRRRGVEAGTLLTVESIGEGFGEYLGELAATGEASVPEAVLESFLSLGQSGVEAAWNMRRAREQSSIEQEWQAEQSSLESESSDVEANQKPAGFNPFDQRNPAAKINLDQVQKAGVTPAPVFDPQDIASKMGINPDDGPLSAAAAQSVNSGLFSQSDIPQAGINQSTLERAGVTQPPVLDTDQIDRNLGSIDPLTGEYMPAPAAIGQQGDTEVGAGSYEYDRYGNLSKVDGRTVKGYGEGQPRLGFNAKAERSTAPLYEVSPDGVARPATGEAARSRKESIDLSSLRNGKQQAQKTTPKQSAEQRTPEQDAQSIWDNLNTFERNAAATKVLGMRGVPAKNTATKAWGKLSPKQQAKLTAGLDAQQGQRWTDPNQKVADQTGPVLQNRDRTSQDSINQMRSISNNPDYSRLKTSGFLSDGAPVVVDENIQIPASQMGVTDTASAGSERFNVQYAVVEADQLMTSNSIDGTTNAEYAAGSTDKARAIAGNGRITGLQSAWAKGNASQYKADMAADKMHGIDAAVIEGMKNPILVRLLPQDEVTDNIGDLSNRDEKGKLSPVEQSKTDMGRIDLDSLKFTAEGAIGGEAIHQFRMAQPAAERVSEAEARKRLTSAIFQKAYGNDQLTEIQSGESDDAKSIMSALAQAAPSMSRLEGAGEFDVRPLITQAGIAAVNAARRGTKLADYVQQSEMGIDPMVYPILEMMLNEHGNIRSSKYIGEQLTNMAKLAYDEANSPSSDMFGEKPKRTAEQVIQDALTGVQGYGQINDGRGQESLGQRGRSEPDAQMVEGPEGGRERPADTRQTAPAQPEAEQEQPAEVTPWGKRSFTLNIDDEYGPPPPHTEAYEAAKSAPSGSVTHGVTIRPSGKQWHNLYLSHSDGSFSSVSIGRDMPDNLTELIEKGFSDYDKKQKKQEQVAKDKDAVSIKETAIAKENNLVLGRELGTIIPNTGKQFKSAKIVADHGDGTFTLRGVQGNKQAELRGLSASSIVRAVDRYNLNAGTESEAWRTNYLRAAKVARDLGIDPKQHKKLAELVAAIDNFNAKPESVQTEQKAASEFVDQLKTNETYRTLDNEGAVTDGNGIKKGEKFRTASGRLTTPYPKQIAARYSAQWLIDNATQEAESRGDDFNATIFKGTTLLKNGTLVPGDKESMNEYLFGQQPDVPRSILKDIDANATDLNLTQQTEETLAAEADRLEQLQKEEAAQKAKQKAAESKQRERDADKARADEVVDDFQLGQSAEEVMSGMGDIFDASPKVETKSKSAEYGASNKLVSADRAAELRAKLRAKLNGSQLNSGLDPEILAMGTELAIFHLEASARRFAEFARLMAEDLGQPMAKIKPYLRGWYNGARDTMEDQGTSIEGMDNPDEVRAALSKLGEESKQTAGLNENSDQDSTVEKQNLTDFLYGMLVDGSLPKDNRGLRSVISEFDGKPAGNARLKEAQEQLEYATTMYARDIIAKNQNELETYNELLESYNAQPALNIRTSTSVANQAYSTPAPMAYLAANLAGIDQGTKVYEPSAGNGMLLITASPKNVTANELEPTRHQNLKDQGFNAYQGDAITAIDDGKVKEKSQDAVITNPPFGSLKDDDGKTKKVDFDGYRIGKIDHLIAAEALRTMKDDGRAALIIGADKVAGGISTDDRIFFNWLYSNYNVTGHIEADGKLYNKQGAGWPVRIISISGRLKSERIGPQEGVIQRYDNWRELYEQSRQILDSKNDGATIANDGAKSNRPKNDTTATQKPNAEQAGEVDSAGGSRSDQASIGNVAGSITRNVPNITDGKSDGLAAGNNEQRPDAGTVKQDQLESERKRTGNDGSKGNLSKSDDRKPARKPVKDNSNTFQANYSPRSSKKDEGILIPVNMAQPMQDALSKLEDEVGDLDQYVMDELGYDSIGDLQDAFMGLQIDSVAASINQIKKGKGVVIADQTGIGKGRQAAAIIRWAERTGKIPVFVTVKAQLFTDMHGDLADIGSNNINPFLMNSDAWIGSREDESAKLFSNNQSQHKKVIQEIARTSKLPEGKNAVFLTYSQINTPNDQRRMLSSLSDNAVFVLDESHNAGGTSATGEFMRAVLADAKGVTYLSATYAKRPDNMPLYFKTDMGLAVSDSESLIDAMGQGGLPLQTIVSNSLVRSGQMFRRERSYEGVNISTFTDTANKVEHERISNATTEALRMIVEADALFHSTAVKEAEAEIKAAGGSVKGGAGNKASHSVSHTQFTSVVHNFVRQMLLGLKADTAAKNAIEIIKNGEKPLIALENTMGSFLDEYATNAGLKNGDNLGNFDYRTVLTRALERTRSIKIEDKKGATEIIHVPVKDLPFEVREAYENAQQVIDALDVNIPVSPLDWIRHKIQEAGYSVAEITGRDKTVDYSGGAPTLSNLSRDEQKDKVGTTRRFNSGEVDALILNVSGSTGISLHASENFKDQRKRVMIIAQAAQDINVFMQMLGRVHRTGQVTLPAFQLLETDLPAEKRPTAILNGKMKSLNANTSSNTESATSIESQDMLNKYGDQVINAYLNDHPVLAATLGVEPVGGATAPEGIARQATGRLALTPVETQKAFYDDVESQYASLIEYLNETNQNDLEPKTFDFEAEIVSDAVLTHETDKNSAFGSESVYGEYKVKRQGKPMTAVEINEEITKNLDGAENGRVFAQQMYKKYADEFPLKPDDGFDKYNSKGLNILREYQIGTMWRLDIAGETYNGIVTNLKNTQKKTGDPFSPSKIQVQFAVNGSLRSITIPSSQIESAVVNKIHGLSVENAFKDTLDSTEVAKIVTGNLLAAYSELKDAKGTVISFTKKDGTVEQGILLPKKFTLKDNTRGDFRFENGKEVLKYFTESNDPSAQRFGVSSRDAIIRVLPASGGITIQVPKSKQRGGKYFLDEILLGLIGDDFVSEGNFMRASVAGSNDKIEKVIDYLISNKPLYTLPSQAEDAAGIVGRPAPVKETTQQGVTDEESVNVKGATPKSAVAPRPDNSPLNMKSVSQYESWDANHTKTGEKTYMVKPALRLERGQYFELVDIAKQHDGYWSRFGKAGFLFKTEADRQAFIGEAFKTDDAPQFSKAPKTDTEAFKKFFGKSKVTDSSGKPLAVYHGSPDVRGIFSDGFRAGMRGQVFFAAADYSVADSYADDSRAFDYQNAEPQTIPLYLSIQNPMVVDAKGKHWRETEKYIKEAKDAGHDGIIIKNSVDFYNNPATGGKATTVYAWFNPVQAKSALDAQLRSRIDGIPIEGAVENTGAFSLEDDRISYSQNKPQRAAQGITKASLIKSIAANYPKQEKAVRKMLERGEKGLKGGAVIINSANQNEIAKVYAEKTGRSLLKSVQIFSDAGQINGFYDSKSGLTFLVAPNLNTTTAPAVLFHEVVHSQQRSEIDTKSMKLINGRAKEKNADLKAFLDTVSQRMIDAGEYGNALESTSYIVEQAVMEGRSQGYTLADSKFLNAIEKTLGSTVANIIRDFTKMVRQFALRHGLPIKVTIDDLVQYAMAGMEQAGRGNVDGGVQYSKNATEDRLEGRRQFEETEKAYGGRAAYNQAKSEGKTKLNYQQWVQVRTPAFKEWFGDWEDGRQENTAAGYVRGVRSRPERTEVAETAKNTGRSEDMAGGRSVLHGATGRNTGRIPRTLIDGDTGEPRVFYHGTSEDIAAFELDHSTRKDAGWLGRGVYVASNPDMARMYANTKWGSAAPNIMPLFVRSTGELYVATIEQKQRGSQLPQGEIDKATRRLIKQGYDGAYLDFTDSTELVTYYAKNVKSASGNVGTFSAATDDISFSRSQTKTAAFKKQFGDSKVVDASGDPLLVYHGSGAKFATFDKNKRGATTRAKSAEEGFFFTSSKSLAYDFKKQAEGAAADLDAIRSAVEGLSDSQLESLASDIGSIASEDLDLEGREFFIDSLMDMYQHDTNINTWPEESNGTPKALKNYIPKDILEPGAIHDVYLRIENPHEHVFDEDDDWHDEGAITRAISTAQKNGNDGVILRNMVDVARADEKGNNAIRSDVYIAFEPDQIIQSEDSAGIRFSRSANPASISAAPNGMAAWDSPSASKFDDFVYKMQDKHVDTKRVIEAIRDTGKAISDDLDVYLQETLFHGRAAKRTQDFLNKEVNPLIEYMQSAKVEMSDLEEFLHARHAQEANALIAKRDPNMPDGGSGMTNAEAAKYLNSLNGVRRKQLENAAKFVDKIIGGTRETIVSYGLESQETVDGWTAGFKHYIPLQREDKDGQMGIGQGFSVKGKETKGRTGSTRKVVDILANVMMQRERAIVRGEKNRVAVALLGLAKDNPLPEFWQVDKVPTTRVLDKVTGLVRNQADPMYKSRDNAIVAKVNGQEHAILMNEDDPRAMRMAEALKNLDAAQLEGLLGATATATRYFAAVNTQYNPIFGVTNFVRDIQEAMLHLQSTPLAGQQARLFKNTFTAVGAVMKAERDGRKGNNATGKWGVLWEDFQNTGGQTGFRDQFSSSADRGDAIKNALTPGGWADTGLGKLFTAGGVLKVPLEVARKKAAWLFDLLSDYNTAMENGVRLSAYETGINAGMSKEQAAALAKGLTVNFNRKGQVTQQVGALYAFFNASVQGTARLGQSLFDMDAGKPKTLRLSSLGKKIVSGGVMLGASQAVLLAMAGFDDEEPPEFIRERNIIIPTGGKTYISIPMPLGYHVIANLGRIPMEFVLGGGKDGAKYLFNLMDVMADIYNPIGNSGLSMQTIAPTVLDPLAGLAENKDFSGRAIAKESFNRHTPGHALARDAASLPATWLAELVNYATGGTEFTRGELSPTPDQIDYLVGQLTGGVGRETTKFMKSIQATATGDDLPWHNIPLAGRFFGDADSDGAKQSAFYNNMDKVRKHAEEVKGLRAAGRISEAIEYANKHPQAKLHLAARAAEKQVKDMRDRKRDLEQAGAPREEIRALEKRMIRRMAQFVDLSAASK